MVTAQTQYSLRNACSYFAEHLSVGDYYDEGQRVAGEWCGHGSEILGLSGKVGAEAFLRLCGNEHPGSGDTLTPRLNTVRVQDGQSVANRRVFYDFTFSPPKSVSLAAFLGRDDRILGAHARAVRSALPIDVAGGTARPRTLAEAAASSGTFRPDRHPPAANIPLPSSQTPNPRTKT